MRRRGGEIKRRNPRWGDARTEGKKGHLSFLAIQVEEACAGKPQAGFCEGEAHNSAWWNSVTLPRPKGGSKQGIQSTPTHWRRPLYSTLEAKVGSVREWVSFSPHSPCDSLRLLCMAHTSLSCWHGQVNEKSLSDVFPLRKAERLGIAKILGLVKAQNLL